MGARPIILSHQHFAPGSLCRVGQAASLRRLAKPPPEAGKASSRSWEHKENSHKKRLTLADVPRVGGNYFESRVGRSHRICGELRGDAAYPDRIMIGWPRTGPSRVCFERNMKMALKEYRPGTAF